jgi:hypothetical protein
MTTEILSLPEIVQSQASKYVSHNTALREIEAKTIRVLSRVTTAQPGSPSEGDTYLLPASSTGTDWAGHDGELAHYYGGAWSFYTPAEGWRVWVNDEDDLIAYDGSNWVALMGLIKIPVVNKTGNYTITTADAGKLIEADSTGGDITITLPTVASAGDGFVISIHKSVAANTVTLDGNGSETINGAATLDLADAGDGRMLVCDGTEWWTVGGGGGAAVPISDDKDLFADDADATKILRFSIGGLTTSTTRTATWPDKDGTVAMLSDVTGGGNASDEFDEDSGSTTGLTWGYKAGLLRVDGTIYTKGASTIALTASSTNYVELDPDDQTVKKNTSGFTAGRIPLRQVTTDGSSQTASVDKRAWVVGGQVFYAGLNAELPCADQVLSRPELKDYAETVTTPSSSSGTLVLDLENGNTFEVTLTENVTTLTISNPPATGHVGPLTLILIQDGTGGWTVSWPSSFKWPGGTAPTLSTGANEEDVITAFTTNAGTKWRAFLAGADVS